jgi:hypothetical protein
MNYSECGSLTAKLRCKEEGAQGCNIRKENFVLGVYKLVATGKLGNPTLRERKKKT